MTISISLQRKFANFCIGNAGAATMAQKEGLFAIKATNDSATLLNTNDFVAKKF